MHTQPQALCQHPWVGISLLCFYFYILCYAAVLLNFTYYAQEQELLSDYYAIYIQVCMNNSLHVVDNFYKDCFIKVYLGMVSKPTVMRYHTMTELLEYIDRLLQFSINA